MSARNRQHNQGNGDQAAAAAVDLEASRDAAKIELLSTDAVAGFETLAFDVIVNGVLCGHWALKVSGGGFVTWTNPASKIDTGPCEGGDREQVELAIRATIPAELATPAVRSGR